MTQARNMGNFLLALQIKEPLALVAVLVQFYIEYRKVIFTRNITKLSVARLRLMLT